MTPSPNSPANDPLRDWEALVPALLKAASVFILFFIIISAIAQGYMPQDDALRHCAYAVSGKTWDQILILNPGLMADHNPGWHMMLRWLHQSFGWNQTMLVYFCVIGLFCCVTIPAIFMVRRAEMWLASLLAIIVAQPHFIMRLTLGRPLLLSIAVLIVILLLWTKENLTAKQEKTRLIVSTVLIGLAIWIHGTWYLFFMPAVAFGLARQFQHAIRLTGCWLAGSLLGAILTGHPVGFLTGAVKFALSALNGNDYQYVLVSEFRATDGVFPIVALVGLVALARCWATGRVPAFFRDPIFVMAALGWILGLKVGRFWLDWGLPAVWIWVAQSLIEISEKSVPLASMRRARLGAVILFSLLLLCKNDYEGRWTVPMKVDYISADKKELEGWLPGDGGIIYTAHMSVFYQTFYKNPQANWRYILGYEPALMPPEDFKTLRNIQWNDGDSRAYQPWLDKIRPQDRLVFIGNSRAQPELPGFEWIYAATDRWIGRPLPAGAGAGNSQAVPPAR